MTLDETLSGISTPVTGDKFTSKAGGNILRLLTFHKPKNYVLSPSDVIFIYLRDAKNALARAKKNQLMYSAAGALPFIHNIVNFARGRPERYNSPYYIEALVTGAEAYFELSDYGKSRVFVDAALEHHPNNIRALILKGNVYSASCAASRVYDSNLKTKVEMALNADSNTEDVSANYEEAFKALNHASELLDSNDPRYAAMRGSQPERMKRDLNLALGRVIKSRYEEGRLPAGSNPRNELETAAQALHNAWMVYPDEVSTDALFIHHSLAYVYAELLQSIERGDNSTNSLAEVNQESAKSSYKTGFEEANKTGWPTKIEACKKFRESLSHNPNYTLVVDGLMKVHADLEKYICRELERSRQTH